MKKIIILIMLFFNLIPCLEKGKLSFTGSTNVYAQYGNEYDEDGYTIIYGGDFPEEGTDIQYGNLCVAKTMENIGDYYGMNLDQFDITSDWADNNNTSLNNIISGGVPYQDLESFIGSIFDYKLLSDSYDITGAIDNGHPIMGGYLGDEMGHMVMILGYDDESGLVTVLDPATDHYNVVESSEFYFLAEILPPSP